MRHQESHPAVDVRPLLILKVGHTHNAIRERLGDFDDWIAAGLRSGGAQAIHTVDPRQGDAVPSPGLVSGVVISGSHAMVSDREAWSEALVPWLRQAVASELPVLGICYGHQLLAHALGGEVIHHPDGVELGMIEVQQRLDAQEDPLFAALPGSFDALSVHWQSVSRLPDGAVWLASSAHEPHHAFRVGRCAWGVQFHPEFSVDALRAYLDGLGQAQVRQRLDLDAIARQLKPTPVAASVLSRFARLVLDVAQPTPMSMA